MRPGGCAGSARSAAGPVRLRGDLWSGNVLWGDDEVTMIDPAAYGGNGGCRCTSSFRCWCTR